MTEMKRITISLSDEAVELIEKARQSEEFKDMSYAEIIRKTVTAALAGKEA